MSVRLFLGGTFNPIHTGHGSIMVACQRQTHADFASFMPCYLPPHKPSPVVSYEHRVAMCRLYAGELSREINVSIDVDTLESELVGPSITISTLRALRQRHPQDRLIWVLGMDSFVSLDTWESWRELTDLANLLVVKRLDAPAPTEGKVFQWMENKLVCGAFDRICGQVWMLDTKLWNVSSTDVRRSIACGEPVNQTLPACVESYIVQHRLYKNI